jgi:uncharacterized protein YcfL
MIAPRTLVLLLAGAALLAGCGDSKQTTVTQVQTVQSPTTQDTATVPDINIPTDTTPTTTPQQQQSPPQQSGGGTRSEAVAKVRAQGYRVDDPSSYHSGDTLRVLVGTKADSGDGYAKRAFFFVGGRYIGTDTSDDSAQLRVENASGSDVTIAYAIYGRNDALCCPGGTATVRYQWDGSRLVPLDPIPPRSRRG